MTLETSAARSDQLQLIWSQTLEALDSSTDVSPTHFAFLTLSAPLGLEGDTLQIAVSNDFTKDIVETRLRPVVLQALQQVAGRPLALSIEVDPSIDARIDDEEIDFVVDATYAVDQAPTQAPLAAPIDLRESLRPGIGQPVSKSQDHHRLNPRFTFDTFVAGSSNRFAHAAAVAVAEQPARAYNPLFIYGDSGLGKTHLLHAIGHYTRTLFQGSKVKYVTSEDFTNEFISSIRDDRGGDFQRRYRDVDVLLVDDIQFLSGKAQTQEEFFHTFNALYNNNKQIVITSDLQPRQLQDFADRMRSRFEQGLTTDVQPPDLETRIAILQKKTLQEHLSVPENVLEYIADRISSNIRELEGALIRVTAFASLNRTAVDLPMAESVLEGLLPTHSGPEITADLILKESATFFGVSIDELKGPRRTREIVHARQVAMYLCRELTQLSLPRIGHHMGGRDHTTVMHADRKVRQSISERRSAYNQVSELTSRIRNAARSN